MLVVEKQPNSILGGFMTKEQLELLIDYIDYKMIEAVEDVKDLDSHWTRNRLSLIRDKLFNTLTGE